jgi:hypothetical protein
LAITPASEEENFGVAYDGIPRGMGMGVGTGWGRGSVAEFDGEMNWRTRRRRSGRSCAAWAGLVMAGAVGLLLISIIFLLLVPGE